jgi:hypothetical protein
MRIKIGDDGKTVYNADTNKRIGVMNNGQLELDKEVQEEMNKTPEIKQEEVKIETQQENPAPPKKTINLTKYEISKDTNFTISFGLVQIDNRFVIIQKEHIPYTTGAETVWVKFRMWNYLEELKWKDECLEYNKELKTQYLDLNKLNEIKIKKLILDWSFSEVDNKFKLLHTDGVLSDESYSVFCGLLPNIANAIVNSMNDVLENNK